AGGRRRMAGQRDPGDDAAGGQRRGRDQPDCPAQRVPPRWLTARPAARVPGARVPMTRVLVSGLLVSRALARARPGGGVRLVGHRPELLSGAGLLRRVPAWGLVHVVHGPSLSGPAVTSGGEVWDFPGSTPPISGASASH